MASSSLQNASIYFVPSGYKAGSLYPIKPLGTANLDVTRATTAFRTNASGVLESVASGVPRLDYPAAGGCPSLLIEPAATNQIRNNTMQGAASGTPGTLPTNWSVGATGGLTREIVGTGTTGGINFIDIRFSGTATGTQVDYRFESTTQISASSGQTWTASLYYAVLNQPSPPNNFQSQIIERNSGGGAVADGFVSISPTSSLVRYSQTRTLTGATTAFVQQQFRNALTNGQAYDFTIRIGWPQMELGSVATSPIPTTNAAVTRNADVISKSGVSGFIGQSAGTLYAEVDIRAFNNTGVFLSLSDGTTNNRVQIYKFTDGRIYADRIAATQSALTSISTTVLTAGIFKIAFAYQSGNSALFINGSQIGSNATQTFTLASIGNINIGSRFDNTQALNDRLRAAAIYTTRLSNTELAAMTSL